MEKMYISYTKKSGQRTYYFVKCFLIFPDLKNVSPVLEGYGMHEDFNKACNIAAVYDSNLKKQLLDQIDDTGSKAKVVAINKINSPIKMIFYNLQQSINKCL